MTTFNTKAFIEAQRAKGISDQNIAKFLEQKGIDPSLEQEEVVRSGGISFMDRLKLGFGDVKAREKASKMEKQAGLSGKFDVGDLADMISGIPSLAGFIAGGLGGTALGGPVGGIAGAGAGSAAGEGIRQVIGKALGVSEGFEPGKIATEGIVGTAAGLVGPVAKFGVSKVIAPIFNKTLKPVLKLASEAVLGTSGRVSLITRFKSPELVAPYIKGVRGIKPGGEIPKGAKSMSDVVNTVTNSLTKAKQEIADAFKKGEENLIQKDISKKEIINKSKQIIADFLDITKPKITTDISSTYAPMNITERAIEQSGLSSSEVNVVKAIINKINSATEFNTKGLLNLKQSIQKLYRGTDNTKQADAIISMLNKHYNGLIEIVDPTFREILNEYSIGQQFIKQLKGSVTGYQRFNVDQMATRLQQITQTLNDPFKKEATEKLLKNLGQKTGVDILELLSVVNSATRGATTEGLVNKGLFRELARILELISGEIAGATGMATKVISKGIGKIPTRIKATLPYAERVGVREIIKEATEK